MQFFNPKRIAFGIAISFGLVATVCQAAIVSSLTGEGSITDLRGEERPALEGRGEAVTWGDGTLADAHSFNLLLDSQNDILLIEATLDVAAGSVFNDINPAHAANDVSPPIVTVCSPFRSQCPVGLEFDLWLTTPSATTAADASVFDQGMRVIHFDIIRETNVDDFHFAHITLVPDERGYAEATLSGEIQTSTPEREVERNQFSVTMSFGVPEPDGLGLALIAMLGIFGVVRPRRM